MIASFGKNLRNPVVLAEVFLTDELNLKSIFSCDGLCVFINLVSHGRGPLLEIKNPDAGSIKEVGDSPRIANIRQSPLDNDSIETRQLSKDVI